MPFWWLIEILFTATLHFISIEIPDYAQINDALYTFSRTFLAKESIYKLALEIYANFPICMCVIFIKGVANYLPNTELLRYCHWMDFFKKLKYNIYDR